MGVAPTEGPLGAIREAWDRVIASDPGLVRARMAISAAVAMTTALVVEYGYASAIHTGPKGVLVAMMLGGVVAMMGSMALSGTAAWPKLRTGVFFPVAFGAGMLPGALVAGRTDLMLTVFVVVMFTAVWARRFGPAFFFYGFMLWMGYFFSAFLGANLNTLPSLIEDVLVGTAVIILLSVTLLRTHPRRTLRRVQRAFGARARAVARASADLLESSADPRRTARARRRLHARGLRLAEAALMIEAWTAEPGVLPAGYSAPALRRRLLEAQLAIDELAHAAAALAEHARLHPDGDALDLAWSAARIAGHLARHEYPAVLYAAKSLTGEGTGFTRDAAQGRADAAQRRADADVSRAFELLGAVALSLPMAGLDGAESPATTAADATSGPAATAQAAAARLAHAAVDFVATTNASGAAVGSSVTAVGSGAAVGLEAGVRPAWSARFRAARSAKVHTARHARVSAARGSKSLAARDGESPAARHGGIPAARNNDAGAFAPAATFTLGMLPGSASVAGDLAARGARWNPLNRASLSTRQAVQVALAGTLAIVLGRELSDARYYWAVLATFVTFTGTSTRSETSLKAANRVVGTLVGLGAGIGLAELTAGHTLLVLAVIVLAMTCGFYVVNISYAGMIVFVTIMVSQLYSVLHEFTPGLLVLRLEETSLGAAIGIAVGLVVLPTSTRDTVQAAERTFLDAVAVVLEETAAAWEGEPGAEPTATVLRMMEDRLRRLALVARPLTRPLISGADPALMRRRLARHAAVARHIRALAAAPPRPEPGDEFALACRALAGIVSGLPSGAELPRSRTLPATA